MNDIKFEWDNNKAQANIEKHGITFNEASTVFSDENADRLPLYDIKALNPRKNPYAKKIKKPVTMNMSVATIEYFKSMSNESGIPYQVLMNYYLDDCVRQQKKLRFVGSSESTSI